MFTANSLCADSLCLNNAVSGGWQSVLNFASNAFFMWQVPMPLAVLPVELRFLLLALFFLFGTTVLLHILKCGTWAECIAAALGLVWLLVWIFGFDAVVWQVVAAFALLNAVFYSLALTPGVSKRITIFETAAAAFVSAILALQFSILIACMALIILARVLSLGSCKLSRAIIAIAVVPSIVVTLSAPTPHMPLYPNEAHLVPSYMTSELAGPRFGPEALPGVINRAFEREAFFPAAVLLASLIGLMLLLQHHLAVPKWGSETIMGLFGCVVLILDSSLLPADLVQIMPLATLRRIIPGMDVLPLGTVIAALVIVLSVWAIYIGAGSRGRRCLYAMALLGLTLIYSPLGFTPVRSKLNSGPAWEFTGNTFPPNVQTQLRIRLISPSYYVVKTLGLWALNQSTRAGALRPIVLPERFGLSASHHEDYLHNIADGNPNTRWSPLGGSQKGNEWLHIKLKYPLLLDGLRISSGAFYTDFARGIELLVSSQEDCRADRKQTYREILGIASWQGSLAFTTDLYPYFKPEHHFELLFPETIEARCILLRQVARHSGHDWSVDDIELLKNADI